MKKFGIIIFVAALFLGILITSIFSFGHVNTNFLNFSFNKKTKGSGRLAAETRNTGNFKGVDVGGIFEVEISAQKDFTVEVEADDNLLPLIRTEVRGGVLHIETDGRLATANGLKVRISAPDIDSIDASGVSKVSVSGVNNQEIRIDTSGASKVDLEGVTTKLEIDVSGKSSINAENLRARSADVDASGASNVSVFAADKLNANASGASRIIYSGATGNVEKSTSGAASISEK